MNKRDSEIFHVQIMHDEGMAEYTIHEIYTVIWVSACSNMQPQITTN